MSASKKAREFAEKHMGASITEIMEASGCTYNVAKNAQWPRDNKRKDDALELKSYNVE